MKKPMAIARLLWPALSAALLAFWAGSGCVSIPVAGALRLRIKKGRPFIIVRNEKDVGWGVLMHPFLYGLQDDLILAVYHTKGDTWYTGLGAHVSRDRGVTWQRYDFTRFPITNDLGTVFYYQDGSRVLTARNLRWNQDFSGESLVLSVSKGGEWTELSRLSHDTPIPVHLSPRGAVAPNGNLLAVGYTDESMELPAGEGSKADNCRCILLRSQDAGMSFQYVSTIAASHDIRWDVGHPCEPAVEVLPDGEYLCVMRVYSSDFDPQGGRTRSPDMLEARSSDGGKEWRLKRMNVPGVMPKLLQMSNGVLVCAFGRPGNNLMFSLDGGHSWVREITLTPPDVSTTGYLDILEVTPDRLLVVYDTFNSPPARIWLWDPPENVNALWGVFIDVKRF